MDKRFRHRGILIGLGILAIIFLCLMVGGAGVFMLTARPGPAYGVAPQVQPPAEGGSAPAPYSYGPHAMGRHGGFGPLGIIGFGFRMLFRLLLLGLLLMLFLGIARRVMWGRRWHHHPGRYYRGKKPPEGVPGSSDQGEWGPCGHFGPWHWHHHGKHGPPPGWGSEDKPAAEDEESDPPPGMVD
jgi:hypothetical protein